MGRGGGGGWGRVMGEGEGEGEGEGGGGVQIERAIQSLKDRIQLDIVAKLQITAGEYAHGGYIKAQKPLGTERVAETFRQNLD